jgi:protein-S-isoprenylcysteine O-methyltransferase Ste14
MIWQTWERKQWMTLVAVLLAVIVVLLSLWPHDTVPDHIEIRVVDSSLGKVYSTQIVPLR